MDFEITYDQVEGEIRFRGRIAFSDLARLKLDAFDRAVIRSPVETAADHLLSLELIYRRDKEQSA